MALQITQVKETGLYVKDLAKSRAFYEGKLGLPCFSFVEGRHAFFRAGNSVLLCFIAEATAKDEHLPPHWGHGNMHFAFECAEGQYDDWMEKVKDQGIVIIHKHVWPNGKRSFYFHDPDEHVAEIVEPGMWGF